MLWLDKIMLVYSLIGLVWSLFFTGMFVIKAIRLKLKGEIEKMRYPWASATISIISIFVIHLVLWPLAFKNNIRYVLRGMQEAKHV